MQVIVNELAISCTDTGGKKPVVLLLHGWGDNQKTFQGIISVISKNYRIISLDLPGFGGSETPKNAWGLNDYAEFLTSFLKKLEIKSVRSIIAHSNGGAIAIHAVGTHTLGCEKLILIASSGIRDVYKGKKLAIRIAAKGAKMLLRPLPTRVQKKLKKSAYKKIGSDLFVAENLQETFKKIITDDVRVDAKKIGQPTLIIYGKSDTATPPAFGKLYNQDIKHSQLVILEGGHFLHQDKPDEIAEMIMDFVG